VKLQNSGKFPETAWRAFKAAKQLIAFLCNFWVQGRNRLAA